MKSAPVTIQFTADLYTLKDWTILRVPKDESKKLPSRGQVSVVGTINGHEFQTVLEPDGEWSHWIKISDEWQKTMKIKSGDSVTVQLTTSTMWPEPDVPTYLQAALTTAPQKVKDKWKDITPMARWEWIRWMNSTANMETRAVRVEKTISKLNGKHRRPCCFNLAACTEPYVAKSGRLMQSASH
jgi:hypothetical protein